MATGPVPKAGTPGSDAAKLRQVGPLFFRLALMHSTMVGQAMLAAPFGHSLTEDKGALDPAGRHPDHGDHGGLHPRRIHHCPARPPHGIRAGRGGRPLRLARRRGRGLDGEGFWHVVVALTLLGLGWTFPFVGAATLLGQVHMPEERVRAQAANERPSPIGGGARAGRLGGAGPVDPAAAAGGDGAAELATERCRRGVESASHAPLRS